MFPWSLQAFYNVIIFIFVSLIGEKWYVIILIGILLGCVSVDIALSDFCLLGIPQHCQLLDNIFSYFLRLNLSICFMSISYLWCRVGIVSLHTTLDRRWGKLVHSIYSRDKCLSYIFFLYNIYNLFSFFSLALHCNLYSVLLHSNINSI